jgi:hypothetical protein
LATTLLMNAPAAMAVSTCGETVPAGTTGVLANDLVCAGPVAVSVDAGATFDMNGHSITVTDLLATGVRCLRTSCTVLSSVPAPGEIVGTGIVQVGVAGAGGLPPIPTVRRMVLRNLSLHDLQSGVAAGGLVLASDVTVSSCSSEGFVVRRLVVDNVTVSGNFSAGIRSLVGITGSNLTVNDNEIGIGTGRLRVRNLVATGNDEGIEASVATLRDSNVTGNTTFDVGTRLRPPRLINTACDRSENLETVPLGDSWGVCALD